MILLPCPDSSGARTVTLPLRELHKLKSTAGLARGGDIGCSRQIGQGFSRGVTSSDRSQQCHPLSPRAIRQAQLINAKVLLAEMFDYANELRAMTQGKGGFTMEFGRYKMVPQNLVDEIIEKRKADKDPSKKGKQLVGAK